MPTDRLTEDAKGVYVISATPFADDGAVDLASADRLVEFYLESGVSGITILGIMGEAPKLAPEESVSFMEHMLGRVDGRVPVVVGVSGPGLDNMANLVHKSMDAGAAGVMIAPMPGLSHEEKLLGYFDQVMSALGGDVPVVYQDYPQSTGVHMSVSTFNRLVATHPQIVMLKHEDCPGLTKLSQIRRSAETQGLRRVSILVGNNGLYLPQELTRGADGAMTGFAYPEMIVEVVKLHQAGEADAAEDLFDAYLPLVRYEQQVGFVLAVRKEIFRRRGILASNAARAPGPKLTDDDHAELGRLMDRLEGKIRDLGQAA